MHASSNARSHETDYSTSTAVAVAAPDHTEVPAGHTLKDRRDDSLPLPRVDGYTIIGRLGEGGMGTVWRALQLSTRRHCALKLLSGRHLASERARRRFYREVELTARLEHPAIARVYDSGLEHGVCFYAMELVDGMPLDRYARETGLSRRQVVALVADVTRAVQHAHQSGVIHRDLKPSNILVTGDGQPKVLDFGLAKSFACVGNGDESDHAMLSLEGNVAGTPAYMSPEQAAGRPQDTRSDVYSLGIILYHLVTGRNPHDLTGTYQEILRRIATEEVPRPRQVRRDLDPELDALLLKTLALNPDGRYATAAELARDLDAYLQGDPVSARPPTLTYLLGKRVKKYRTPLILGAIVVLAAFVLTTVFGLRIHRDRNKSLVGIAPPADRTASQVTASRSYDRDGAGVEGAYLPPPVRSTTRPSNSVDWVTLLETGVSPDVATDPPLADGPRRAPTSAHTFSIGPTDAIDTVTPLDGGQVHVRTRGGETMVWDVANGSSVRAPRLPAAAAAVSGLLRECLYPVEGGALERRRIGADDPPLTIRPAVSGGGTIRAASFLEGSTMAVSVDEASTLRLWDLSAGHETKVMRLPREVFASPPRLVPGAGAPLLVLDDGSVVSFDRQLTPVRALRRGTAVGAAAASASPPHLAAVAADGAVGVYDLTSGQRVTRLDPRGATDATAVALDPHGSRLAVGRRSGVVELWHVYPTRLTETWSTGKGPVRAVAFSLDGESIIATSDSVGYVLKLPAPQEPPAHDPVDR